MQVKKGRGNAIEGRTCINYIRFMSKLLVRSGYKVLKRILSLMLASLPALNETANNGQSKKAVQQRTKKELKKLLAKEARRTLSYDCQAEKVSSGVSI